MSDIYNNDATLPTLPAADPPAPQPQFTAEQIEKARREEREKVQRERQRLKDQSAAMAKELEELRAAQEEQRKKEEAESRKAQRKQKSEEEKDLNAREILARREQEWESKFESMQKQMENLAALARHEAQYTQLQMHKTKRITEEQAAGTIAPVFLDYIAGDTPEKIEESISIAKEKTAQLRDDMGGVIAKNSRHPGVSPNAGPTSMGTRTQNEQVADQINGDEPDFTGMNFSQFVANRSRLIRGTAGDQGIFG